MVRWRRPEPMLIGVPPASCACRFWATPQNVSPRCTMAKAVFVQGESRCGTTMSANFTIASGGQRALSAWRPQPLARCTLRLALVEVRRIRLTELHIQRRHLTSYRSHHDLDLDASPASGRNSIFCTRTPIATWIAVNKPEPPGLPLRGTISS